MHAYITCTPRPVEPLGACGQPHPHTTEIAQPRRLSVHPRSGSPRCQDVAPGQCAKPQLADRAEGVTAAAQRMKGRRFVCEVKFDGERCQVWAVKGRRLLLAPKPERCEPKMGPRPAAGRSDMPLVTRRVAHVLKHPGLATPRAP
jgi:hypothetical protein